MNQEALVEEAKKAREFSYSPYSHFRVGAALLCADGSVYTGCNIENAAFSPTNCAERTAVFKAVSEGKKEFVKIAVVGDDKTYLSPCGVCRQVLMEFVDPMEFEVIMAGDSDSIKVVKLAELLPESFSPMNLKNHVKKDIF
ncbi:MAG: cytidine deaminase [Lachnospiraceae bacterium]|nr:cytidine deaminase [Lachnospiraceae bacterium]